MTTAYVPAHVLHAPAFKSRWINGSIVNGHQLGFLYWECHCSCGEFSWGGKRASADAWWRRHFRRVTRP